MLYGFLLQITQPGEAAISNSVKAAADTLSKVAATIPATNSPTQAQMSLWDLLIKGGVIMIPILILSLISIYVLIERYITIRKANSIDKNFMNSIRDFVRSEERRVGKECRL